MNNLRQSMLASQGSMLSDRGAMLSEVANFGAIGINWKGYTVNAIAGTQTYTISQPGNMRNLIGLNVYVLTTGGVLTDETISLNINSELVLDNISAKDQAPQFHQIANPVIRLNRQLTGNDDIKVLINSQGVGGILLNLVFYYSPYAPQK